MVAEGPRTPRGVGGSSALAKADDAPDPAGLARVLGTRVLGRVHEHHASIGSTNDRALEWARDGAPHGALVTADVQTAGRGRRGRSWASRAGGGLYASLVVHLRPGPDVGALGLCVGLGLVRGLRGRLAGVGLKWPNDLWWGGRKLGGVLCEARWGADQVRAVAGFGVNVAANAVPAALAGQATSLEHACGTRPGRAEVLAELLAGLEPTLDTLEREGFAPLQAHYEAACVHLGRRVWVLGEDGSARVAVALGVARDGGLRVRADESESRIVRAGEVSLSLDRPRC